MPKRKSDPLEQELETAKEIQLSKLDEIFLAELDAKPETLLYDSGKSFLEAELGIKLERSPSANASCNIQVYRKGTPQAEPGIAYPPAFAYCTPLSGQSYDDLLCRWREALRKIPDVEVAKFWFPVLGPGPKTVSADIERYVSRWLNMQSSYDEQSANAEGFPQGIAISPNLAMAKGLVPRAFVPERDWFDERYHSIGVADIVTIMPAQELRLFTLFLGRVLAGRSNSIPVGSDEPLSHGFRKLCLMYGRDPRTGKSSLAEFVTMAMRKLGYRVASFGKFGRFNNGPVLTADLAFSDDGNRESIDALLSNPLLKQIVTGAQIPVENKGTDAFRVTPCAGVWAITNDIDQTLLWKKDSGVVDRLGILYTYSHAELSALPGDSPDKVSYEHIHWLAEKHNTTPTGLMFWLFRLCLDEFLAELERGDMERRVAAMSHKLRFPITSQTLPNIVQAMHLAFLLRRNPYVKQYPLSNKRSFASVAIDYIWLCGDANAFRLRSLIKADWDANNRPDSHAWLGLNTINKASLKSFQQSINETLTSGVQLDEMLGKCLGSLRNNDGIAIGHSKLIVSKSWSDCIATLQCKKLRELAASCWAQHEQYVILHEQCKSRNQAKLEYIEREGFDAEDWAKAFSELEHDVQPAELDYNKLIQEHLTEASVV